MNSTFIPLYETYLVPNKMASDVAFYCRTSTLWLICPGQECFYQLWFRLTAFVSCTNMSSFISTYQKFF